MTIVSFRKENNMNDKIKLAIYLWWRCMWYANYSIRLRDKAIKYYKKANRLLYKEIRKEEVSSRIKYKVTTYSDLAVMYSNMADKFDERCELYRRELQKMSMKLMK